MTNSSLPFNDAVRDELEAIMRDVVALADSLKMSGVELLSNFTQNRGGDVAVDQNGLILIEALLDAHTTPEFDVDDLAFDLMILAEASGDNFNE